VQLLPQALAFASFYSIVPCKSLYSSVEIDIPNLFGALFTSNPRFCLITSHIMSTRATSRSKSGHVGIPTAKKRSSDDNTRSKQDERAKKQKSSVDVMQAEIVIEDLTPRPSKKSAQLVDAPSSYVVKANTWLGKQRVHYDSWGSQLGKQRVVTYFEESAVRVETKAQERRMGFTYNHSDAEVSYKGGKPGDNSLSNIPNPDAWPNVESIVENLHTAKYTGIHVVLNIRYDEKGRGQTPARENDVDSTDSEVEVVAPRIRKVHSATPLSDCRLPPKPSNVKLWTEWRIERLWAYSPTSQRCMQSIFAR